MPHPFKIFEVWGKIWMPPRSIQFQYPTVRLLFCAISLKFNNLYIFICFGYQHSRVDSVIMTEVFPFRSCLVNFVHA